MELECKNCHAVVGEKDIFCGNCGKKIHAQKQKQEKESIQWVIGFYLTYLVYAIVSFTVFSQSYTLTTEIILEGVFVCLTLGFVFFDPIGIFRIFSFKNIHIKNLGFSVLFPMFSAALVYYGMGWVNLGLFGENDNIFWEYEPHGYFLIWIFVFYVIIPPLFEELAFRGFLFNKLLVVATPRVTMVATAFIFAFMHFSLISIVWLFPFGLVLGYLRYKYKTLWLGMLIHFIHNLLVVLLDYYYFIEEING